MPTSITVAFGLIHAPLIKFGLPTATIKISAVATSSAKFSVKRWQTVGVPPASIISNAIGRPTIFDAPTIVTFLPFTGI